VLVTVGLLAIAALYGSMMLISDLNSRGSGSHGSPTRVVTRP
jgi:hypothetical protein